jgi:hypothetical protein
VKDCRTPWLERGGGCYMQEIWAHRDISGQDVGTQLVQTAQASGCQQIVLGSFRFKAPGFYQQCGVAVFAELATLRVSTETPLCGPGDGEHCLPFADARVVLFWGFCLRLGDLAYEKTSYPLSVTSLATSITQGVVAGDAVAWEQ